MYYIEFFKILTEIIWYELDIIAISMFSKTIMFITEYDPKTNKPQNLVNPLMPASSKLTKSTRPNPAQNRVWDVSKRLHDTMKQ